MTAPDLLTLDEIAQVERAAEQLVALREWSPARITLNKFHALLATARAYWGDRQQTLALEVAVELRRAQSKHTSQHSLHEGYAVILEELDELWDEVRAWQPGSDTSRARKEAIQIAAMALRLVYDVCDRQALRATETP